MTLTPQQKDNLKKEMVSVALSQIGVHEEGGNNQGLAIKKYQEATLLAPGPWAWCSAFTCWVLMTAAHSLKLPGRVNWRCRDASAFGWEKWGRNEGLTILDEHSLACAGDVVIFDFSHIGIVVKDQQQYERTIETVEGNTNGRGQRDSESGDGVFRKIRDVNLVKCYVRF